MKRLLLPYEIKFKSGELSSEIFYVLSFEGIESLNDNYEFNIKIISSNKIELKKFLETKNRNLFFTMTLNKNVRYIHGICTKVCIENSISNLFIYNIKVIPYLAHLDIGIDSRIFLDMNIEEIISSILKENYMINGEDYEFILNPKKYDLSKENYEEIDYICQYRESSFKFIQRWISEYGIRFHFEQDKEYCKIIFSDSNNAFSKLKNEILEYTPTLNYMIDSLGAISQLEIEQNRIPLKASYMNNDLRYEKVPLEIEGKVDDLEEFTNIELKHFGGTPFIQKNSIRYQVVEDERIKSQYQLLKVSSNEHFITPGYTFKIKKHFFIEEITEFLILKVKHKGNQLVYLKNLQESIGKSLLGYNLSSNYNLYENSFEAIDNSIEYRVQRVKNKPIIPGIILAKIKSQDGGEQAYRSEDCSYQVKMPFDLVSKGNKYSCWIHTLGDSQGRGLQVTLQDGDDIAIGFIEGDVNRPYIIGAINQKGSIIKSGYEARIDTGNYNMIVSDNAYELFKLNGGF